MSADATFEPAGIAGVEYRSVATKASGDFAFLTDRTFAGSLWAAVIRSPHPCAEVTGIDTGHLLTLEGVEAAFTWADMPTTRFNPALTPSCPSKAVTSDKRLLTDAPRHVGDGVAVVVAQTRAQALLAAAAAQVNWRPKPAVLSLDQAIAESRILGRLTLGDPRAGEILSSSPLVVRERFEFSAAQHNCLEPHACAAIARPGGDGLQVWTNSQCPAEIRRLVAFVLDLDEQTVNVRKVDEGGGFGGKQELFEEALVGWLALRLGRPVRLTYTRREELTAGRVRAAGRINLAMGFDSGGRLLASDMSAVLDSGAYASHTPQVLGCLPGHVMAVYPRAAHSYTGVAVGTNTIPAGAYRGYGVAEANFAVEQIMDMAARRLGLDPVEIRLRNVAGDKHGRGIAACLARLGELQDPLPESQSGKACHGRGLAIAVKHSIGDRSDLSAADVVLWPGPALLLRTGTCDSGTGSTRALAQIVAAELGVPLDCILVQEGDTAYGIADIGSTAQRSVFIGGEAARAAAQRARAAILGAAGDRAGDLALRWPYLVDAAGAVVTHLADLAAEYPPGSINGHATVRPPGPGPSYGALSVDVVADPETGQVRAERAVAVIDCGRVVDAAGARGQVIGGIVQGIGLTCFDEWLPGPDGAGPGSLFDHGVPGALDTPEIVVAFQNGDAQGPPCGLGELPIVPVSAAVTNAVAAAVGVRCTRTPARPAAVWRRAGRPETGAA